jgi:hypothetical protein
MLTLFRKEEVSRLIKYLPGYVIFLGVLKLIIFYEAFNIRIVSYLDFSEVLVSFLDTLIVIVAFLLVPLFILLSFLGKPIGEANTAIFNDKATLNFWKRLGKKFKEDKYVIISSLIVICLIVIKGKWTESKIALLLSYTLSPAVFFIAIEIRIAYVKQFTYTIPATYMNIFFTLWLTGQTVIYFTLLDINSIKYSYKYLGSEIQYEQKVIKSDSVNTFVGQTKAFIFFYNLTTRQSTVYTKDKLVNLSIRQN